MDIEANENRLASMRQDYSVLRETLGVSGVRRVNADLIDTAVVVLIAVMLRDASINPWFSVGYFLIRDLPPIGRSFGKSLTGIRIYSADSLTPATSKQLIIRGLSNFFIVLPFGLLLLSFFFYVVAAVVLSGFIFFVWGRDSIFLKHVGYDMETGQTIADRMARTHLNRPCDVEALRDMNKRIESLAASLRTQ